MKFILKFKMKTNSFNKCGKMNAICFNKPGARFTKQTYNNFYPKFLVKQSYNNFRKKCIEKIRLTRKLQ